MKMLIGNPWLNQSKPKNLMLVTPPGFQGRIVECITNDLTGPAKNNNLFSDSSSRRKGEPFHPLSAE
jgi:hypothetical protein